MHNKCCVVSCGSKREDANFYRFPKSEIAMKKWLRFINCDKLRSLSLQELRKHFVCKRHFEKRFLKPTHHRSRLRVCAYPTLFTDSEIASGIPENTTVDEGTKNTVLHDHDYLKRKHEDHSYSKVMIVEKRPRMENDCNIQMSPVRLPLSSIENLVMCKPSTSELKTYPVNINKNVEESSVNAHTTSDAGNVATTSVFENPLKQSVTRVKKSFPKLLTHRKRVISKRKELSSCCNILYNEYTKSRKQLEFKRRANRALKFSEEKSFEKLTKNINPLAKKILWSQIKQSTKQPKGRRFTYEEKLIALSIMKQSPKCYRFLHKIFILPSKYTLNKMVAQLNVDTGVNPQVFEAVKQEVSTWKENKKYCSILFDEISLEAAVTYDKHNDCITGFVELNERINDFADHALVFMLRGAVFKWQQPLAFFFCKGATSAVQLKIIITKIVTAVSNTGLLPIALVSDQGSAFQSALKSLQDDSRRQQILTKDKIDDVITINGHKLSIIYDPPHLIKGIRNNFITKDIVLEDKISKWNDILEIYKTDCSHSEMRLLHRLNDEHVIPEKIKKMKVKNCVKVLSQTVASTLSYSAQFSHYANGSPVSATLKNTSEIVLFFDQLFDSVNGATLYSKNNKGKPLRHAVIENSSNHRFWREAIDKLEKIKFVYRNGKKTSVPSLKNFVTTLKSMQRLWQFFKSKNLKIMRPRYFNSDPIENFFGQVRAYNFRNNDPNCHNFKTTFRSLLITRFIQFHSDTYNCEDDSGEQLLKLKNLFIGVKQHSAINNSLESSDFQPNTESFCTTAGQERLNIHSRAYTAGWVVRNVLSKVNCAQCHINLTQDENVAIHTLIKIREYKSLQKKKLTYPSEAAVIFFGNIVEITNNYLEISPEKLDIAKTLKKYILSKYSTDFVTCEKHKNMILELFVSYSIRLTVFNWCKIINQILKGTDVFRLEIKKLPYMQLKALQKYKTRLKNKKCLK